MPATLKLPTDGLSAGQLRTVIAMAEAVCDEVGIAARYGEITLELQGLATAPRPVPLPVPDRLPAELYDPPAPPAPEQEPDAPPAPDEDARWPTPPAHRPARASRRSDAGSHVPGSKASLILEALTGGPVEDPKGFAGAILAERAGLACGGSFHAVVKELESQGLIVRERPNARRTTRIALAGQARAPRPASPSPARPERHVEPAEPPPPMDPPVVLEVIEEDDGPDVGPSADERRQVAREAAAAAL